MRERRRKHDDVHHPMQGRGKKASRIASSGALADASRLVADGLAVQCPGCGANQTDDDGKCGWCGVTYRSPAMCPVCRMRFLDSEPDGYTPNHGDVLGDEPCDGVGELLTKVRL